MWRAWEHAAYKKYHHYPAEMLSLERRVDSLESAGLTVVDHYPILFEVAGRLFILVDQLWHTPGPAGETGEILSPALMVYPGFVRAWRNILTAVLEADRTPPPPQAPFFWPANDRLTKRGIARRLQPSGRPCRRRSRTPRERFGIMTSASTSSRLRDTTFASASPLLRRTARPGSRSSSGSARRSTATR
jgi:hypothetical protein